MNLELLAGFALAAFAGGFIDAIVGEGGLITLPALLLGGLGSSECCCYEQISSKLGINICNDCVR